MGVVHFLNVNDGDCSIIQHVSGRVTMIDICNGNMEEETLTESGIFTKDSCGVSGNWGQKNHPVNPINYLSSLGEKSLFRFILTHPDMDHMDGIKKLYEKVNVENFWDTDNNKTMDDAEFGNYHEEDWDFYQSKRGIALNLYDGTKGKYYNADNDERTGDGDYLQILCPTKELMDEVNDKEDYNNGSYMILYNENERRILFCGDAKEKEWDVVLENHEADLANIDVLIAPHHGRKSGGNDEFLDVLNPKLTLFGNAKSDHLNYDDWNNRDLLHFTNNQGGSFVLVHNGSDIRVYCTNEKFAKKYAENNNRFTTYSEKYKAWHLMDV